MTFGFKFGNFSTSESKINSILWIKIMTETADKKNRDSLLIEYNAIILEQFLIPIVKTLGQ